MCLLCEKQVPRKDNAKRHVKLVHMSEAGGAQSWVCEICNKSYKTDLSLDTHKRSVHGVYKSC